MVHFILVRVYIQPATFGAAGPYCSVLLVVISTFYHHQICSSERSGRHRIPKNPPRPTAIGGSPSLIGADGLFHAEHGRKSSPHGGTLKQRDLHPFFTPRHQTRPAAASGAQRRRRVKQTRPRGSGFRVCSLIQTTVESWRRLPPNSG